MHERYNRIFLKLPSFGIVTCRAKSPSYIDISFHYSVHTRIFDNLVLGCMYVRSTYQGNSLKLFNLILILQCYKEQLLLLVYLQLRQRAKTSSQDISCYCSEIVFSSFACKLQSDVYVIEIVFKVTIIKVSLWST